MFKYWLTLDQIALKNWARRIDPNINNIRPSVVDIRSTLARCHWVSGPHHCSVVPNLPQRVDMSTQTPLLSHRAPHTLLLLHSTALLSCCHMTQRGRERHVLQRTDAITAHAREKVEWSLELFHSSEQKIFALSPMKVHKLLLEVKCIGDVTSIGISDTSPVITWYKSNTKFCSIAYC